MILQPMTFITGNAAKAKYLSDYFHFPIEHKKLDLKEIQSLDLREITEDKVKRAFEVVQSPVLVEDTSLVFKSLKGLPGPLIKWFFETLGNDGLCKLVDGLDNRSAYAEVQFALYDGVEMHIFEGRIEGTTAGTPRGDSGFGWDPIFIPNGYDKTWAEMTEDEKHETSMRKIALEKLAKYLEG